MQHEYISNADTILDADEELIKLKIGWGYRAKYLIDLCIKTINDKQFFLGNNITLYSPKEFFEKVNSIKGIGAVSAGYVARMYEKPFGYALDAYALRKAKEIWGVGSDNAISHLNARYKDYSDIGPLIFWFEITRHWHDHGGYEDDLGVLN